MKNNEDFHDILIDFWLDSSIIKEQMNLTTLNFIEDETERFKISNYLENSADFSTLRKMIYEGAPFEGVKILEDTSKKHDRLTFFTISYLCAIFWMFEDAPNPLYKELNPQFKDLILKISKNLRDSNSKAVVDGLCDILKMIRSLNNEEKPKKCENLDFHKYPKLTSKKNKNFNEFIINELDNIKLFQPKFDVFKLFNTQNKLIKHIVLNIYNFLKNNNCSNIIGVERSGVPLAAIVAYELNLPLHILRTVPELKLLPVNIEQSKAVVFDDISISGTNLNLAKIYLKKLGVKSVRTLVLVKDNNPTNVDEYLLGKKGFGSKYKIKNKLQCFNSVNIESSLKDNKLKNTIKKCCTKNGYWYSEYAYSNEIFRSICDVFIKQIENKGIQNQCLIVSTSIFGLPFASVVSYKLNRPVYLFARRPNLVLDFSQKEELKSNFKKGITSIVFIDDVFSSGSTEEVAEQKLLEIAENIKIDVHKFVIAFLGDETKKQDELYYIVKKSDLL